MKIQALHALEFERVRDLLVQRAVSAPGKELARVLRPLAELTQVRTLLKAVGETVSLRLREPNWPEIRFPDIREILVQARIEGAVLEPKQLLEVSALLALAARLPGLFRSEEKRLERPQLAELAGRLLVDRQFPKDVERAFDPSGEVRDDASRALRSIRLQLRRRRQEASHRLESMSRTFRGSGEGSFVTLRGGRYVLSVASGERRRVQGIVHDRSATGKTVYLEPLEIVELNNTLAELEADERLEIHRILREMTAWVRSRAQALDETQAALARLDEMDARARLAEDLAACAPTLEESGRALRIVKGRHPLLLLSVGKDVVPLDLTLEKDGKALVISGPNMGGKTVMLKTVGLLVAMGLSGLFVPASDGTVIPWVDEIFIDIGDEQSLDFDLSTYGGHLRNMEAILTRSTERSLVLIDELGAGTDPDEGAALGIALLEEIGRRGSLCVATTHLGAFKAFAAHSPGFRNAAMEHDPDTLAPTYTLHVGLPGRSHAFELARREGWPDEILQRAGSFLSGDRVRTEDLLAQIQSQRQRVREEWQRERIERERLEEAREEAERLSKALQEKIDSVRVEKALEEDRLLQELRRLLQEMKEKIGALEEPGTKPDAPVMRRWVHERERMTSSLEKTRKQVPLRVEACARPTLSPEQLVPGRVAYSRSLGVEVTLGQREQGGERIWVRRKGLRVLLLPGDLAEAAPREQKEAATPAIPLGSPGAEATREALSDAVSAEVDLRGMDREHCLRELDLYLDRVMLAGLTRVRIIHGKGTGVLRQAVQQFLETHPQVRSYRTGEAPEGGWGVTMALLRTAADKAPNKT